MAEEKKRLTLEDFKQKKAAQTANLDSVTGGFVAPIGCGDTCTGEFPYCGGDQPDCHD